MRLALLASVAFILVACSAEQLRDNQQGWRRAQCEQILDARVRERCLREAEEINQRQ
jgi:hypothetical protein